MFLMLSFFRKHYTPSQNTMKISSLVLVFTCLIQQLIRSNAVLRDDFHETEQSYEDISPRMMNRTTDYSRLLTLFSTPEGEDEIDEDETANYIVQFHYEIEDFQQLSNEITQVIGKHPKHMFKTLIHGCVIPGITKQVADKIASIDEVKRVEKDVRGSAVVDVDVKEGRHLQLESQQIPWGIERVNGGRTYTGENVAFVVDTGIELSHPDLNVHPTLCFSAFEDGDCNDLQGHGTHVAGTIGAIDNDIGVVGVAAGVRVVPVKVLDDEGKGSVSDFIRGIEWVAENGKKGDVCNMSLRFRIIVGAVDDVVINAAKTTGIKFILAAGNEAVDTNTQSPPRVSAKRISTIAACDQNGDLADFSNQGTSVDYCAPGVDIISTYLNGGYTSLQGTSMAAPHAAGVFLFGRPKKLGPKTVDSFGNKYLHIAARGPQFVTCGDPSDSCDADDDCCAGSVCSEGVCGSSTCGVQGDICLVDSDCCSGLVCPLFEIQCAPPAPCGELGAFCFTDSECCSGFTCSVFLQCVQ